VREYKIEVYNFLSLLGFVAFLPMARGDAGCDA